MKKLFLYLFYQAVKLLVKLIFRIFYAKTVITNKQGLYNDHPGVVVSNHPNALIDPLQVASRTSKMQHFLANINMFEHPIGNWFFGTFYCIPIERPKDVEGKGKEAQKKRAAQNRKSFARCNAFLASGGSLYIAPQGGMELERRVTKFKTGTARIVMSAESANDFSLGLYILPIGLNYIAANEFRSNLLINVGQPLRVDQYREMYQEDVFQTVRQMTADLETQVRALTIHTLDDKEDAFLHHLETIETTDAPLGMEAHFHRTQQVLQELRHAQKNVSQVYQQLQATTFQYFEQLRKNKSSDAAFVASQDPKGVGQMGLKMLGMLIGFPLFLYGWLNNFLACYLPSWIAQKMKLFEGYKSTVKMISSIFVFPIIYGLQVYLIYRWGGNAWWSLIYFLSLYPLGLLAWWYRDRWQYLRQAFAAAKMGKSTPGEFNQLIEQRKSIQALMAQIRLEYKRVQPASSVTHPKP
ncbi:MAG: 1-acyl-sn-glycerol-3-phosphate acyltransferase [Bacteroidota bacterium]